MSLENSGSEDGKVSSSHAYIVSRIFGIDDATRFYYSIRKSFSRCCCLRILFYTLDSVCWPFRLSSELKSNIISHELIKSNQVGFYKLKNFIKEVYVLCSAIRFLMILIPFILKMIPKNCNNEKG